MRNKPAVNHPIHKLWIILDQTYFAASKCQEEVFAKAGLTLQQYRVLMVIDSAKTPVTPTDVSRWLDRNTNSISLLIDRMEKLDLVKRVRDLKDRRSQRLAITPKAKKLLKQATEYGLELMEKMMSCCADEEIQTLISLLDKLRERALEELIPDEAARKAKINGPRDITRLMNKPKRSKTRNKPQA